MPTQRFETVDVFTTRRFGGNPLAVFPRAEGIADQDMQRLAAELNLSETTFVLPPADPANTARVRIFNRSHEMPFAGHPMVGTAYVLARGLETPRESFTFEIPAGLVEVRPARRGSARLEKLHQNRSSCAAHLDLDPAGAAAAGSARRSSSKPRFETPGCRILVATDLPSRQDEQFDLQIAHTTRHEDRFSCKKLICRLSIARSCRKC